MKKELIFIIFIFLIFMIGFYVFSNYKNKTPEVCFEENCFLVEIAETQVEKTEGLMFRENLEEKKGMLFVYDEEEIYNFWMKNTLISLDIIWINAERKIVYIEHEAQPCDKECGSLSPSKNAQFVLEIKGGTAEKLNIALGGIAKFHNINK